MGVTSTEGREYVCYKNTPKKEIIKNHKSDEDDRRRVEIILNEISSSRNES